jgi:hypothetical protein
MYRQGFAKRARAGGGSETRSSSFWKRIFNDLAGVMECVLAWPHFVGGVWLGKQAKRISHSVVARPVAILVAADLSYHSIPTG